MVKPINQTTRGTIYEVFGRNVARFRVSSGLSQSEAAARLGMPQSTYSGYESGTRKVPLSVIVQIAELYGVTPDELITGAPASADFKLSNLEIDIILRFRSLPEGEKNLVLRSLGLSELSDSKKESYVVPEVG